MALLPDAVAFLEKYLNTAAIADYPNAWNGLQLENSGRITKLGAAVDACESVIKQAVAEEVSLLLVHHGLMWEMHAPLFTGVRYRKLKCALDHDLAIYSSHLPLDVHPAVGNNAQLCQALGLGRCEPFFAVKGQMLGLRAQVTLAREELAHRLEHALGRAPLVCAGGPEQVIHVGVVTGGAGSEVAQAAREGVDTFITGEGPHWSYTAAEELGINVFYGGHYATETFGVKALAAHLAKRLRVPWTFLDHPTGL